MNILIRLEQERDYREVENMMREAFWDVYKPGCDEHLVVHKIRKFDAFMALELKEDGLKGITGRYHEDSAYEVDKEELESLEKGFPYKEKHVTDAQLKG